MNKVELKGKIIEILNEINPLVEFNDETDLMEEILDSMGIVYLITELMIVNVKIPFDEVTPEHFSSVDKIVELASKYSS